MTAYVYFYLIAIVTLRVKGHSLQERIVLGNLLIVDHQVIYIYLLPYCPDSKKGLITQYQTKTKLKLICFVSFKNQNSEMYCLLLTAFYYL